jgi:hypothetical protein
MFLKKIAKELQSFEKKHIDWWKCDFTQLDVR